MHIYTMSHRSDTVQRELQEGHQDGSLQNLYMNSRGRIRGRAHGRSGGELREHRSVLSETENLKEEAGQVYPKLLSLMKMISSKRLLNLFFGKLARKILKEL